MENANWLEERIEWLVKGSNRDGSLPGSYPPLGADSAILNYPSCRMKGDSGADMPGDSVKAVTDCELPSPGGLNYQVFLTLQKRSRVRKI